MATKCCKRRRYGVANIEAFAGAAKVAFFFPLAIPLHLIQCIEAIAFDETACETKRHGRVVGPLSGTQVKWSSTNHVGQRFETTSREEFHRSSNSVSDSKSEKTTPIFFEKFQVTLPLLDIARKFLRRIATLVLIPLSPKEEYFENR